MGLAAIPCKHTQDFLFSISLNLFSGPMKDGIIRIDRNASAGVEDTDQELGQDLPQAGRLSSGFGEEAMVGAVSSLAFETGEGTYGGDSASDGTGNLTGS